MDREKLLETFYEVVHESVEWYAEDGKNNTYTSFINGVLSMTDKLLEKVEINNSSTIEDVPHVKTTVSQTNRKHTEIIDGDSLSM